MANPSYDFKSTMLFFSLHNDFLNPALKLSDTLSQKHTGDDKHSNVPKLTRDQLTNDFCH